MLMFAFGFGDRSRSKPSAARRTTCWPEHGDYWPSLDPKSTREMAPELQQDQASEDLAFRHGDKHMDHEGEGLLKAVDRKAGVSALIGKCRGGPRCNW
jgi:hypothetical protein